MSLSIDEAVNFAHTGVEPKDVEPAETGGDGGMSVDQAVAHLYEGDSAPVIGSQDRPAPQFIQDDMAGRKVEPEPTAVSREISASEEMYGTQGGHSGFMKPLPVGRGDPKQPGLFEFGEEVLEWAETENEEARSLEEWVGRTLPVSAGKLGVLLPKFLFHDLPRPFTDAALTYAKNMYDARDYASVAESRTQFVEDVGRGLWMHLEGWGRFQGEPLFMYGWEAFRHRLLTDPAGFMLALLPIAKGLKSNYINPALTREAKAQRKAKSAEKERKIAETEKAAEQMDLNSTQQALVDVKVGEARATGEGVPQNERVIEIVNETKKAAEETLAERASTGDPLRDMINKDLEKFGDVEVTEGGGITKTGGELWSTKASANNARLKLKEKGLATEVVETKGGWELRPFDETAMIDNIMSDMSKREMKEGRGREREILDEVDKELNGVMDTVEVGPSEHRFAVDEITAIAREVDFDGLTGRQSLDSYVAEQVNNVNLWRHGREVDIGDVRAGLDNAANNVWQMKKTVSDFEFKQLQDLATEAATWAREARVGDIPDIGEVGVPRGVRESYDKGKKGGGDTLYSGIPVDEIVNMAKGAMSAVELSKVKMAKLSDYDKLVAKEMVRLGGKDFKGVMEAAAKDPKASMGLEMDARKSLREQGVVEMKREEGVKLYTGIPLDEIGAKLMETYKKNKHRIPAGARKVKAIYDLTDEAKKGPKGAAKMVQNLRKVENAWVDTKGGIKRDILAFTKKAGDPQFGNWIRTKIIASSGGGARAAVILGNADKTVWKGVGKNQWALDRIIMSRRVMELDSPDYPKKGAVHPGGTHGVEHVRYLESLRKELGEKVFDDLWQKSNNYFDVFKNQLHRLYEGGLISEKTLENLKDVNWIERQNILDALDVDIAFYNWKTKMGVERSGVTGLKKGNTKDLLETDTKMIMQDVIGKNENRIMMNQANLAMAELGKRYPDNPYVRTKNPKGKKWTKVDYYEAGKKQSMYMEPGVAKNWLLREAEVTYEMAQGIRIASGSAVLKPMATGTSPVFAIGQVPMDALHMWATSDVMNAKGKWQSTYNPVAAPLQMMVDFPTVIKEATMRDGRYLDFVEDGAGMEWLAQQGTVLEKRLGKGRSVLGYDTTKFNAGLESVIGFLGYPSATTEIMGRLALRERAVKKIAKREGVSVKDIHENKKYRDLRQEASIIARDYIDYGQSGSWGKAADAALPYFNPGIQATRGLFKTGRRNAKGAMGKIALMAVPAGALYLSAKFNHPEFHREVNKGDWDRNFCFPFGPGIEDEMGQIRYPYFKIKKDPGQRAFFTMWELGFRSLLNDEVDPGRFKAIMRDMSPADVSSLPPTASAMIGYSLDVNTWHGGKIWHGPKVEPKREFITVPGRETPPAMVDIGQAMGMSPERLNYALEEMFTGNSVYAHAMGVGYNKMFRDVSREDQNMHWAVRLSRNPWTKRFIGLTNPYDKHRDTVDEVEVKHNTERYMMQDTLDALLYGVHARKTVPDENLGSYIAGLEDPVWREWAENREKFFLKTLGLRERSLWLRLHRLAPEPRARVYKKVLDGATPEERELYDSESVMVHELWNSDRFLNEMVRLEWERSSE